MKKNTGGPVKRFLLCNKKKLLTISLLSTMVIAGASVLGSGNKELPFVNLKILPKNISSKLLNQIMVDDFSDGLGVSCMSCHAEDSTTHRVNYASDANPQKNMARRMMKMTLKINRQFFGIRHPSIGGSTMVVTCFSCHRGTFFPNPPE
jgi:hypothetical protein